MFGKMRFDGFERRRRVERQTSAAAGRANCAQRLRDIMFRLRFDVDRDGIGARFEETRHVMIGMLDHEMDVERKRSLACAPVATIAGPNEMLSTKWPSMMSRCKPIGAGFFDRGFHRRDGEKSAARMEGATRASGMGTSTSNATSNVRWSIWRHLSIRLQHSRAFRIRMLGSFPLTRRSAVSRYTRFSRSDRART